MKDTVGFGLVGVGPIAEVFAADVSALTGAELRAVCPVVEEDPSRFAQRFVNAKVHLDADAVVASPDVDAVIVVSPASLHAEHAITALQAGKHVLVEKPMAVDASQVRAMSDAARTAGRLLLEAYPAAFEPNVAALREAVARIPRLRRAVFVKDQYSSASDAVKAGQMPPAFDPRYGGGSILDLGFYPVSLAVHLLGEPVTVTASGSLLPTGADDQGVILLGYDDVDVVCLHSKVASSAIDSQVAGEHSVLRLDDISVPSRVELLARGGASGAGRSVALVEDLSRPRSGSHVCYAVAAFVALIREGILESGQHPLANTLAVHRVLDEARRQVGVRFPSDGAAGSA